MKQANTSSNKISKLESVKNNESVLEKLVGRIAQNFQDKDVDIEILENYKISKTLDDFISPYSDSIETDEEFLFLLDIATIAWNLSFFSKREQRQEIEKLFIQDDLLVAADTNKEIKDDFKRMLVQLITRKKRYFSNYKRMILDFELKTQGDSFHLAVVSLPIKKNYK